MKLVKSFPKSTHSETISHNIDASVAFGLSRPSGAHSIALLDAFVGVRQYDKRTHFIPTIYNPLVCISLYGVLQIN